MLSKKDVEIVLNEKKINKNEYSLDESQGYYVDETYCLRKVYSKWLVFYCEKGQYSDEREFDSESEACEYFIKNI